MSIKNIKPMLAEVAKKPFDGNREWLFEVKWDGERCLAIVKNNKTKNLQLFSRYNKNLTDKYPELAELTNLIQGKSVVLDGEICVLDKKGLSRFELLQQRIGLSRVETIAERMQKYPVHFFVFDILELNGRMLTALPLIERKKILKKILREGKFVHLTDFQIGKGLLYYKAAKKLGLEGIIAKKVASPYKMGARSRDWLKIKIVNEEEFVIGGWTEGKGARCRTIGALLLGYYDKEKKLKFAGHVGTGFNSDDLFELEKRLKPLEILRCPFVICPKTNTRPRWVKPRLVCQVRFAERTEAGFLRQPVYLGLRKDKKAKEVVK